MTTYQPPTLRTYAQRKHDKETALALAAGQRITLSDAAVQVHPAGSSGMHPGQASWFPHDHAPVQPSPQVPGKNEYGQHMRNATPLPLIPSGTGSPGSRRPLPSPARHANTNRISTTPANLHQRAPDSPFSPGLHHYASQPNLMLHRDPGYRPPADSRPESSETIRSTPSIPNLRIGHISSPSINPSPPVGSDNSLSRQGSAGGFDTGHRPLPKPLKSRSSNLQRIPEPPGWTPSTTSSSQTLASAMMDRSDTLTSVKSLDRWDLSQQATKQTQLQTATTRGKQRPLPSPPGQVDAKTTLAISRSLDRGVSRQGVQALGSPAEGPTRGKRRHVVGSISGAESEKSTGTEPESGPVNPSSANTFPGPAAAAAAPASGQTVDVLTTLHHQVTSAMAEFRIDDMPVAAASQVRPTMPAGPAQAPEETVATLTNDVYPVAQEEAISPIQIPTIVFPDSDQTSPESIMTPAVVPSPFAKYTTAPPPIAITNVDNAECTATPTISVSEDGMAQRVEGGIGSPTSNLPAPSSGPAGISERSVQATPRPLPSACGIFCHSCDLVILGNIVNAMEKGWHPACFKCTTCGMPLEHVSSFEHEGKPYCHMDYHEQFAPKCHHCNTPIIDQRFITIDDPNHFGKRFYHELHFFCGECGTPFLDPSQSSAAGTEGNRKGDSGGTGEEEQTAAFVIHGKHAFCPECDIKLHRPKCRGCRNPIRSEEEALEALKTKWHRKCFKCTHCHETIPTRHFIPIDRKPYCQDCYAAQT